MPERCRGVSSCEKSVWLCPWENIGVVTAGSPSSMKDAEWGWTLTSAKLSACTPPERGALTTTFLKICSLLSQSTAPPCSFQNPWLRDFLRLSSLHCQNGTDCAEGTRLVLRPEPGHYARIQTICSTPSKERGKAFSTCWQPSQRWEHLWVTRAKQSKRRTPYADALWKIKGF